MYKNFNDWCRYDGFSEGSGSSEQWWIVNKETNEIGLFKFPKSPETTDHISEKIAADIAKLIGLGCANIDLGIFEDRIGIISYKINDEGVDLIEGINVLNSKYKNYDSEELIDVKTGECYSLQMILNSLEEYNLEKDFLKIVIFDFLIGNSDRHDRNWAILRKDNVVTLCPVYDNASSLCSYVNENVLEEFFMDHNRLMALVDTKSRTLIRIDRFILGKKGPKHSDMIKYIKDNFYEDTIDFVEKIKATLTHSVIEGLIDDYVEYLSPKKVRIIKTYLKSKHKMLLDIYNLKR